MAEPEWECGSWERCSWDEVCAGQMWGFCKDLACTLPVMRGVRSDFRFSRNLWLLS